MRAAQSKIQQYCIRINFYICSLFADRARDKPGLLFCVVHRKNLLMEYRKQDIFFLCESQTYGGYSLASSASVATNAKIGSASKRTAGPICLLGVIPNPHFQERHFVSAAHSFGTLFITDRFTTCLSSLYHAIGIKSVIVCRQ